MTERRATVRAVSDDFGDFSEPYEKDVEAQTSSEGALSGGAMGEERLEAGSI